MKEEAKWYIVQTYSGHENKVASNIAKVIGNRGLKDMILETKIPVEKVIEIKNGKKHEVEKKIYPGYLLIKMELNDLIWHTILGVRGVVSFAGSDGRPIALTKKEEIKLGVEVKNSIRIEVPYKIGDSVKIIDGPLEDYVGVVIDINFEKEQLKIVVSIFGRDTSVVLSLDSVISMV